MVVNDYNRKEMQKKNIELILNLVPQESRHAVSFGWVAIAALGMTNTENTFRKQLGSKKMQFQR